jgi:glutathione S-transferase
MADFHIYVGYRTVSSWSLRGWLPMKKAGVPFEETLVRYRSPAGRAELDRLSPTGKVPFLVHRRPDGSEARVWDSLAIAEYLAETVPDAHLWPQDPVARAHARAIAAEMHSGFTALRNHFDMALTERCPTPNDPQALKDVARIEAIWRECRERWGKAGGGPFLFGRWSIADAAYAPVVTRFRTYGVTLGASGAAYMEAVLADPDFLVWESRARADAPPEPRTP